MLGAALPGLDEAATGRAAFGAGAAKSRGGFGRGRWQLKLCLRGCIECRDGWWSRVRGRGCGRGAEKSPTDHPAK